LLKRGKDGLGLSVNPQYWGEDYVADHGTDRVKGIFKQFVKRSALTMRIVWEDGVSETGALAQLIQHGLEIDASQADVDAAMQHRRRPSASRAPHAANAADDESDPESDGGTSEESDVSDAASEHDEPPEKTTTGTGLEWERLKEQIRVDARTSGHFQPRFRASHADFTAPHKLFVYMMPDALLSGACEHTNANIADRGQHIDLPELVLFYSYVIGLAVSDHLPIEKMWSQSSDCFTGAPNMGRHKA
jgi:hypothetical protein